MKSRHLINPMDLSVDELDEIFTLAHEIGHAYLHLEDRKTFIDDAITISSKSADEMEQEANYFAVLDYEVFTHD